MPQSTSVGSYKNILIIKVRGPAETALLFPVLHYVRKYHPHAAIDLVVSPQFVEWFKTEPAVRNIYFFDRSLDRTSRAKSIARLGLKLIRNQYDCAVALNASPSVALLGLSTRARMRVHHFHKNPSKSGYSTVPVLSPAEEDFKKLNHWQRDWIALYSARLVEGRAPLRIRGSLELRVQELDWANQAWTKLENHHLAPFSKSDRIPRLLIDTCINRGTGNKVNSWALEKFALSASRWVLEKNGIVQVLVPALNSEADLSFLKTLDDCISLQGLDPESSAKIRYSIGVQANVSGRQAAALGFTSDFMFGNPSGYQNVALAAGAECATLIDIQGPKDWITDEYSQWQANLQSLGVEEVWQKWMRSVN